MTFPAPYFIQNRNHFRAAAPIRRGWPVMLAPSDPSRVVECDASDSAVIGIADAEAPTGGIVEIAWIGFVDVALAGAALGAEVRLAADGSPIVGGDGRFIGIAGGASFGGYTVTRLGLLGYLPAAGGGGGSEPIPVLFVEADQETFQTTENEWKHSLIILPGDGHPSGEILNIIINAPNDVAEPGYQFTQFYTVVGQASSAGSLGLEFGDNVFALNPNPVRVPYDAERGGAAFEILWTYVDGVFGGNPIQGWMPSVTNLSGGFSPESEEHWTTPSAISTVAGALNQLAARITALEGA